MNIDELSKRLTDRENPVKVHLIGVAGSGMSGLALLLLGMGHHVSGSDMVTSGETQRMQGLGLNFSSPHRADEVHAADVVVYSSAVDDPRARLTPRLTKFIAKQSQLEVEEVERRAQRKAKALTYASHWVCLALVAREQGLVMDDIAAALSVY